eukprot:3488540-Rhodomonas_salina.1
MRSQFAGQTPWQKLSDALKETAAQAENVRHASSYLPPHSVRNPDHQHLLSRTYSVTRATLCSGSPKAKTGGGFYSCLGPCAGARGGYSRMLYWPHILYRPSHPTYSREGASCSNGAASSTGLSDAAARSSEPASCSTTCSRSDEAARGSAVSLQGSAARGQDSQTKKDKSMPACVSKRARAQSKRLSSDRSAPTQA